MFASRPHSFLFLASFACLQACAEEPTGSSPGDVPDAGGEVSELGGADLGPSDPADSSGAEAGIPRPTIQTPCEELLGTEPEVVGHQTGDESTIFFEDQTDEWGLPEMYSPSVSVGDVNQDGFPDLYVPGWVDEASYEVGRGPAHRHSVFLGCGERFFEVQIPALDSGRELAHATSSHIADMDGDGLVDLVFAHLDTINILYQTPSGSFERVMIWERSTPYYALGRSRSGNIVDLTIADFDADGLLDIYASHYGGVNPLLRGIGSREFDERAFASHAYAQATSNETYASAFIPPVMPDGERLLYLAHHDEPDQVWSINSEFRVQLVIDAIPPFASMGVDYFYLPDRQGIVTLISEQSGNHFFLLEPDRMVDVQTANPFGIERKEWGIQFADFDNDGNSDAAFPTGDRATVPEVPVEGDYGLLLTRFRAPDPPSESTLGWVDASAQAGPAFDGTIVGEFSAVVSADLDLDGCIDLLATPMPQFSNNPTVVAYTQPIQLLRNRCGFPGNWVGFVLDDPGAFLSVRVKTESGEVERSADVQAGSGLACDGASEQVHIGLGELSELIELEIRCNDGRVSTLAGAQLRLNAYNDLGDACAPSPD